MRDKTNAQRLIDLRAHLEKTKARDKASLNDIAGVWGVTKPRFVNKMKDFVGFPEPTKVGNAHFFNKRAAIQCMIAHLERHEQANQTKAGRMNQLLGDTSPSAAANGMFNLSELQKINALQADMEERAIARGELLRTSDVSRLFGSVFSSISEFISNLSNYADPHGKLPPATREAIDKAASRELVRLQREIKKGLGGDVAPDRAAAGGTGAQ